MAVRLAVPAGRSAAGVKEKFPLASATAVPIDEPPLRIVTVAPASAVPVMVGVVSFVGASSASTGAPGAVVSIVRVTPAEGPELLPAGSWAVAVRVAAPVGSAFVGVKEKLPLASAIAVPIDEPPLRIVTVAPASAVPVMVGVVSFVGAGGVSTGTPGAVVSTVRVTAAEAGEVAGRVAGRRREADGTVRQRDGRGEGEVTGGVGDGGAEDRAAVEDRHGRAGLGRARDGGRGIVRGRRRRQHRCARRRGVDGEGHAGRGAGLLPAGSRAIAVRVAVPVGRSARG